MLNRGCAPMGSTSAEIAPHPGPTMEKGHRKPHSVLEDGLGQDLMDAGRFCFNCEQIFSNRRGLEDHVCTDTSYICSCGTEFTLYNDMLEHSTTHEPGHQVLYHETIKKRRIEKRREEEAQLKRLQTGDVVWGAPQPRIAIPMLFAPVTQAPEIKPSLSSETPAPTNPGTSAEDSPNVAAGLGSPAVDMWAVYQPVVLLKKRFQGRKKKAFSCGTCGQCFQTISSLIHHHDCHVVDKVSCCLMCGLLLSSKKAVPRFHFCDSSNTSTKFRLITATPLSCKEACADVCLQRLQATTTTHMQKRNPKVASQSVRTPCGTSSLQMKNLNIGAWKSGDSSAPKPNNEATKTGKRPPFTAKQLRARKISAARKLGKPMSSAPNWFPCRICHLAFETDKLLQRHKCAKAREFLRQNALGGRQLPQIMRFTPLERPVAVQMNGERNAMVQFAGNMKTNKVGAGVVLEDECYGLDSAPDKTTEMIYQVTSSVPIKT